MYQIRTDSWSSISDIPKAGVAVSCAIDGDSIFICSIIFKLYRYSIDQNNYQPVGIQSKEIISRSIVVANDKLYLFEEKIFEMDKQGNVLDTFTTDFKLLYCPRTFVNSQGMIYMLQFDTKQMYFFDPIKNRQLVDVADTFHGVN